MSAGFGRYTACAMLKWGLPLGEEDDVHPRLLRLVGCGLLIGSIWLLGWSVVPVLAQGQGPDARLILAFYYASYDWDTWSRPLCDKPESLYVSADGGAVARHLRQAETAGIDALLQAWYGPEVLDNPAESTLEMLLSQASAGDVAVAAMFDLTPAQLDMTGNQLAEALIYLRDQHMVKSTYLRVGGRPVVFLLGQDNYALSRWEAVRNRVDPDRSMIWIAEAGDVAALEVFDGFYLYDVAEGALSPLQLNRWADEVRQWYADSGQARFWVAPVLPGYDSSYLPDGEESSAITVRDRDDGDTYRDSWAAADASRPDWIAIRSYNGWSLCTHVEPSTAFGDSYLDLTADMVARYRLSTTPTPTPTMTLTPTATPTLTPTVVLTTPTATATPLPTVILTPTATAEPTATPFRLSTPTPTVDPDSEPPSAVMETPGRDAVDEPLMPQLPQVTPTPTPMPRLPVEGNAPRRCTLLPLWLSVLAVFGRRRRLRRD